jgi:hypothetical protein
MRWAVEDCQLDGAAKPILFVIAYRANRDTGECWAGQRRIAREAGVTRTHVQRVMADLIRTGVLEVVGEVIHNPSSQWPPHVAARRRHGSNGHIRLF